MSIWFRPYTLEELQRLNAVTMAEHLDIRFTELGTDYLRATMPVDERTRQPFGLLHGGASVTLAETLGSVASNCCVDSPPILLRRAGNQRQPHPLGPQRAG